MNISIIINYQATIKNLICQARKYTAEEKKKQKQKQMQKIWCKKYICSKFGKQLKNGSEYMHNRLYCSKIIYNTKL